MAKEMVGLYLKEDGWSLAQLSEDAKTVLHFHEREWRFAEPEERATELRSYWQEHQLPKQVTVAFQDPEALWSLLELPPLQEKELSLAVKSSLEDMLPVNGENLWVYSIVGQNEDKLKVLAGAVRAALVNAWVNILEEAGLTPEGFVLNSQALAAAAIQGQEPTAFVLVEDAWTTIGVAQQNMPIFFRTFATPQNVEELVAKIRQESLVTRHAWQRQEGENPQKIKIITGNQQLRKGDFEGIWGFSGEEIEVSYGFGPNTPSLLVAKGAAILGSVNTGLLVKPRLPLAERRGKIQVFLTLVASVLLLGAGFWLFIKAKETRRQYQVAWMQENVGLCRELERLETQTAKLHEEIEEYRKYRGQRKYYLEFLSRWQKIVPENTVLTTLTLDGARVVNLSGQTPAFAEFFSALNRSGIFKEIKIKGSIIHNPNGYDEFTLSGELKEEVIDGETGSGK